MGAVAQSPLGKGVSGKPSILRAATHELSSHQITELKQFLHDAFDGEFSDEDFEHCVGGVHFLLMVEGTLIGHASVIERALRIDTTELRIGYLEAMAIAELSRGKGWGSHLLTSVNDYIRLQFGAGALSTGDNSFYTHAGWQTWHGPSHIIRDQQWFASPEEDGGIMTLDIEGSRMEPIAIEHRAGDAW